MDHVGFIPYTGKEPDGEFFYKAEIQLKITHDGRRYFEELQLKGTEARSKITAYLDTNIVSRLAKTDTPAPVQAALASLLELFNQQKLELVTSDLSKKEIDKLSDVPNIDRDKLSLAVVVTLLKKIPFIEDQKLLGIHSQWGRFGGVSYPLIEDDPVSSTLRGLGLDRTDAHHVMLAIRARCDVFLTLDKRTILNRRSEIEKLYPIRLMDPEEFARAFSLMTRA